MLKLASDSHLGSDRQHAVSFSKRTSPSGTGTKNVLEYRWSFGSNLPAFFYIKAKVTLDKRLGHNSKQSCLSRFRSCGGFEKPRVTRQSGSD